MIRDREISLIIERLLSKRRFRRLDQEKVLSIFDRAQFHTPAAPGSFDMQRIKNEARSRKMRQNALMHRIAGPRFYAAAAACMVLVISVMLFRNYSPENSERSGIRCTFAFGDVKVTAADGMLPAGPGTIVRAEDVISTGDKSFADLIYGDDIKIRIGENTVLKAGNLLRENGLRFSVEISTGKALLDFRKLSRSDRITVKTPTSVAGVRGTRFGVLVRKDRSVRYEVHDGKISVRNRVTVDPELLKKDEVKKFVNRLEESLEEKAVIVEKHQVCEVDGRRNDALIRTVENIITADESALSEKLPAETNVGKAEKAAAPRVYTTAAVKPVMMNELEDFTEDFSARAGTGKDVMTTIHAEPGQATIMLDGKRIGYGKLSLAVREGKHTLEVSAPGFETRKLELEITGDSSSHTVVLGKAGDSSFDFISWIGRIRPSYIIADARSPYFISIDHSGRIEAVVNGKLKWSYNAGSEVGSYPVPDHERIYITTVDEKILALSLISGKPLWKTRIEGGLHFGTRLVISDTHIFAASAGGSLYKLNKNGNIIWKMRLPAGIYASPALAGNLIFVPVQDGNIYAVDTNLRLSVMKFPAGKIVGSSIMIQGNRLFAATFDGRIICYDYKKDERIWQYKAGSRIIADMAFDESHLFVTAVNGDVLKLTTGGQLQWKLNIGGTIEKNPVIENGNLYVLAREAFYVIDGENGQVTWSFVLPSDAYSNIAFTGNNAYFGTRGKGIIRVKK